ncbi:B-cell receptor-associated protein 31-like [Pyrus ussuriensis x Pyrus communis]|uniref:Endoplasmic reticulum transmembrane protein n=1 Tax=Pyrus ussuriensis x Pyrus communis TaxID=2448454 RepID=A0A5N5HCD0_9ROSA|nr:B-cell receptor-associated protein 31-like [Pyrus ussuriensis x Pyrus communis]
MIQLLFIVILSEMVMILAFLFKTPFRKLVILGLDQIKRGRGPVVVKTVAATVFVVVMTNVYSIVKIRASRIDKAAVLSPTDQVLMIKHLLDATLMGCSLFLALMIDRLHHYIRELRIRRKSMEALKKQNRGSEDGKSSILDQMKVSENEMATLRTRLKQLESEIETKTKDVHTAESNVLALRKQSEGFLLEYDRLLEENQKLKNQLKSLDWRVSRLGSKKDS